MQATCPKQVPSMPRWASQIKRRSLVSCEKARRTSINVQKKVISKAPVVATKLSLRTCALSLCSVFFVLMLFAAMQFAGLTEVQYALARGESELAKLNHKQVELGLEIDNLTSLERIEREAKLLGMGYPNGVGVVDVAPSSLDLGTRVATVDNK